MRGAYLELVVRLVPACLLALLLHHVLSQVFTPVLNALPVH